MYKLVALDMDGTLLNSEKKVTDRNRLAIAQAKKKGVMVILASGRPLAGMKKTLEELKLTSENDFVVSSNGSYVHRVSDYKNMHSRIITGKDAKRIANLASELNVHMHAFSLEHGVITPKNNPFTDREAVVNGISVREFDFSQLADDHQIVKAMFADDPKVIDKVTPLISSELHKDYTIVRSAGIFLEFLNPQSNKGVGVATIADHLGIKPSEIITVGDAENDHHMLKYAGLGVAMGNATQETKALANYITDTHENSGVAQVIEKFILNI